MDRVLNDLSAYCGGLDGKKILDVGCDTHGNLISEIAKRHNVDEIVGMGLNIEQKHILPSCRLENGDIRKAHYPDNYFDLVISLSAFEHVHNLPLALEEMHRILKPEGILWSRFGPIWSCSYGHHLWFRNEGQLYNYWNVVLPPYCHLLMNQRELYDYCIKKNDRVLASKIADYVYNSSGQNRLFFEDYEVIFKQSDFNILIFAGYNHDELYDIYKPLISSQLFERLQYKYPSFSNFFYQGILVLLKKIP